MKKIILILFFLLLHSAISFPLGAATPPDDERRSLLKGDLLDVELKNPGTLADYLVPGDEKRVRCIRLSGAINGDDIKVIKKICGRSSACDENGRSVNNYVDLELERVRIVGGGSSYSTRTEHDVIGHDMFAHCNHLRSISLPRMLKRVDKSAFYGCYNLEEVRFLHSDTRSIGDEAFSGCSSLSRINLPDAVETLGDRCFYECTSLRRIDLPSALNSIGEKAFYKVPITSVRWPLGLTFLGSEAFDETNLSSFYIPRYLEIEDGKIGKLPKVQEFQVERGNRQFTTEDGVLFNIDGNSLMYFPLAKRGDYAVPSGVVTICDGAFCDNSGITSVTFPQSLTTIGAKAFKNCTSLRSIIVPEGVTAIGSGAFANCNHMTTATVDADIAVLPASTFEDCVALKSVVLPANLTTIGESAFENCKLLQSIEWSDVLTVIMKNAFKKCGFTNLELPSDVRTIGENAFRDCKSLESIVLSSGISTLEKEIFRGCEKLVNVTLPSELTVIGENLFRDCKTLPRVAIPAGVTTIFNNAFRGTAITEITLPASVIKIGDKICEKCKMQSITCFATIPPTLSKISDKKTPLYVPAASVEAYKQAKPWKDFKNILPIQ